jgi:hypothetical protein
VPCSRIYAVELFWQHPRSHAWRFLRVLSTPARCSDAYAIPKALFTIMGGLRHPTSGQLRACLEAAVATVFIAVIRH